MPPSWSVHFIGLVAVQQKPVAVFQTLRPQGGMFAILPLDTPESLRFLPLLTAHQRHRVRLGSDERITDWLPYEAKDVRADKDSDLMPFPPLQQTLLRPSLAVDASLLVKVGRALAAADTKQELTHLLMRFLYGLTAAVASTAINKVDMLHFASTKALYAFLGTPGALDKTHTTINDTFLDAWRKHHARLSAVLPALQRLHKELPMAFAVDALLRAAIPAQDALFTGEAHAGQLCDLWLRPLVHYSALEHPLVAAQLTTSGVVSPAAWATYVARAMVHTVMSTHQHASSHRFMVADLTKAARGQLDCTTQTALDLIQAAFPATGYYRYRLGQLHLSDESIRLWVTPAATAATPRGPPAPTALLDEWEPHLPAERVVIDLPLVKCLQSAVAIATPRAPRPERRADRLVAALTTHGILDEVRAALAHDPLLSVALLAQQDSRRVIHGDVLARDTPEATYIPITHGDLTGAAAAAAAEGEEATATPRTTGEDWHWPSPAVFGHVIIVNYHAITSEARARDLFRRIAEWRDAAGYGPADGSLTFMGCASLALGAFWRPLLNRSARYDYDLSPVLGMEFCLALSALVRRAYETKRIWLLASTQGPPLTKGPAPPRLLPTRLPPPPSQQPQQLQRLLLLDEHGGSCYHLPLIPMYDAPDLVGLPATRLLTVQVLKSFNRQQLLGFLYRLVVYPHAPPLYTYMATNDLTRAIERVLGDPHTPATGHWLDSD